MYQIKIKILIVDDEQRDVDLLKSALLPVLNSDFLFPEDIIECVEDLLRVDVLHSVPDALEYLHGRAPNLAIVDVIFNKASRHMPMADERQEGLHLIEKIKSENCDAFPVFCVSSSLDLYRAMIDRLGIGEWVVSKHELHKMTTGVQTVLRQFAQRELASIEPDHQARLARVLDADNWAELTARTLHHHYFLRNLMAGWASIVYDDETGQAAIRFPDDIVETIKSLLPYADGKKTETADPG